MTKYRPGTPEEIAARLDDLKAKLKARTNPAGEPLPNYGENVAAIRTEIARLEAL